MLQAQRDLATGEAGDADQRVVGLAGTALVDGDAPFARTELVGRHHGGGGLANQGCRPTLLPLCARPVLQFDGGADRLRIRVVDLELEDQRLSPTRPTVPWPAPRYPIAAGRAATTLSTNDLPTAPRYCVLLCELRQIVQLQLDQLAEQRRASCAAGAAGRAPPAPPPSTRRRPADDLLHFFFMLRSNSCFSSSASIAHAPSLQPRTFRGYGPPRRWCTGVRCIASGVVPLQLALMCWARRPGTGRDGRPARPAAGNRALFVRRGSAARRCRSRLAQKASLGITSRAPATAAPARARRWPARPPPSPAPGFAGGEAEVARLFAPLFFVDHRVLRRRRPPSRSRRRNAADTPAWARRRSLAPAGRRAPRAARLAGQPTPRHNRVRHIAVTPSTRSGNSLTGHRRRAADSAAGGVTRQWQLIAKVLSGLAPARGAGCQVRRRSPGCRPRSSTALPRPTKLPR